MTQTPLRAPTKTTFMLDTPFPIIPWPILSDENQAIVLEQLCSLLKPIGKRRVDFVQPSKGKRKKRKRSDGSSRNQKDSPNAEETTVSEQSQLDKVPPEPEVASFLTVGFNSTERALEAASRKRTPDNFSSTHTLSSKDRSSQMVAIFVDRADQTPTLYAHLPLLVSSASLYLPFDARVRLVALPRGATRHLSAALHIPRASMIGLYSEAPSSAPLVDFVRKHVSPIEVPWLKSLQEGKYVSVEIATKQIAIAKRSEKPSRSAKASPVRQPRKRYWQPGTSKTASLSKSL